MGRIFFTFFFVSTISTKILLLWKNLKKHWRLKIILLLGIALIYGVAICGRRLNSDRKIFFFFSLTAREKNTLRGEHFLLIFLPTLPGGSQVTNRVQNSRGLKIGVTLDTLLTFIKLPMNSPEAEDSKLVSNFIRSKISWFQGAP